MELPIIVYQIIFFFTVLVLVVTIAGGFFVGFLWLFRRARPNPYANKLYALLLWAFSFTMLDRFLVYSEIALRHPRLSFLPIYFSFSLGPLLFYYVKSRLYPKFRLHREDIKHFVFPVVQAVILLYIGFQSDEAKHNFRRNFFSPFYGNFEKGVYILFFFFYLYSAYRFIGHERMLLKQIPLKSRTTKLRRQILITGWLKRMVKGLFILFAVNASFILVEYFSFKIFKINLNGRAMFTSLTELSFGSMIGWLIINGYFAWRRKI
jgi:hypothetical protein